MASDLPVWNLLCSTSFIQLTSRKPCRHHFLIHPAYFFLQHPSFLQHGTIFKIHLFCDATLPTDCMVFMLHFCCIHDKIMIFTMASVSKSRWHLFCRGIWVNHWRKTAQSWKNFTVYNNRRTQPRTNSSPYTELLQVCWHPMSWCTHLLIGL